MSGFALFLGIAVFGYVIESWLIPRLDKLIAQLVRIADALEKLSNPDFDASLEELDGS